jgi:hypothetical protein
MQATRERRDSSPRSLTSSISPRLSSNQACASLYAATGQRPESICLTNASRRSIKFVDCITPPSKDLCPAASLSVSKDTTEAALRPRRPKAAFGVQGARSQRNDRAVLAHTERSMQPTNYGNPCKVRRLVLAIAASGSIAPTWSIPKPPPRAANGRSGAGTRPWFGQRD